MFGTIQEGGVRFPFMETDVEVVPHDFPAIELVLALVSGGGEQGPLVWGSAVFVAPGVSLAASHVIEDYWKQFDDVDGWRVAKNATFPIQAIQYLPRHDRFVTWHVSWGSHRDTLDVCLLQLIPEEGQYPAGYVWPYPTLDLRPVTPGTRVQAFGFPKADVIFDAETKGWVLQHAPGGSVGVVTEVFEAGMDRVKIPFPCFTMNLEIQGGMSGGPVVNAEGNVCGIIAGSWTLLEPRPHWSFASLLRPALELRIVGTGNLGAEGEHLTLGDLARREQLFTIGLDR